METMTIEQEVVELIEALKSQEGQTLIQFLDATSSRLQEIHQDLQSSNASLSATFLKLENRTKIMPELMG